MERTPSRKSSQATCARIEAKGGDGKVLPREEEFCTINNTCDCLLVVPKRDPILSYLY